MAAAAALAASTPRAAVAFTAADTLPPATAALLRDHQPANVVIIGGDRAVSPAVAAAAQQAAPAAAIERIGGATRAATAARIARRTLGDPSPSRPTTVIIANGHSPSDLGAAAALAARTPRSAILYTAANSLPAETAAVLAAHQPADVVVIGGTKAVSSSVTQAIRAATASSPSLIRYSGATRTHTAASIARAILR